MMFNTIVHALVSHAENHSKKDAYSFVTYSRDNEALNRRFSFSEIGRRSAGLAMQFGGMGLCGRKALLMYPPGMEFILALYGCFRAGVIAVPIYLPDTEPEIDRLISIIATSDAGHILMDSKTMQRFAHLREEVPDIGNTEWIKTDLLDDADGIPPITATAADTALIQYTSGSTAAPKGVEITHGNLVHNLNSMGQHFNITDKDKMVIWIPHCHDMGLISGIILTMYHGISNTLFSHFDFIRSPDRWLQLISQNKATLSLAPNFGFDLCVRKVSEAQMESLDLSSWSLAFNAAEPVRYDTICKFSEKFKRFGFQKEAFYPAYGLAESTLLVSGGKRAAPPVLEMVKRTDLGENRVLPPEPDDFAFVVGCGKAIGNSRIKIVDPVDLKFLGENQVGEVWVQSPSVAKGYYGKPSLRNDTFNGYTSDKGDGPFLRTGDLGFLRNQELFITGRIKDVIIIRGKNHYPNDIENTIDRSHPACREGCCAVFSIEDGLDFSVIAVVEVRKKYYEIDREEICRHVRNAVASEHGISLYDIVLLQQKTIAKTSSGKIRRRQNRLDYIAGDLQLL